MLKPLAGKAICRKCHPRCESCTGYGFHEQVCQKCAGYKRGEQCEDECPSDHYADEVRRECFQCHEECRGCTNAGVDSCISCHHFRIYEGDPNDNSTSFNCTASCTPEYPYKIFPQDRNIDLLTRIEPYCSAVTERPGMISAEAAEAPLYLAILFVTLLLVCIFSIISIFYCRQKVKTKMDTVNMTRQMAGCDDSEPLRPSNVGPNLSKFRIIKEQELRRGGLLGMGAFGHVYKGVWVPENENVKIPVAIKILVNLNNDSGASREFLDEAYIMATVEHPNLLKLLAVCMTSQMMLITQLMPLRSLLEYVKDNKDKIGSNSLLTWSTQIAKGMAYLEERRLVHRDLAARNVLVQTPSHIKITDFGLAKLLSNDSNEYKAAGGKMPIKWLALECIQNRIFTTKSDVWAFGVTIWEILSFGKRPYENIPAKDVPDEIERGERLPQPEICTLDVYCRLLECWCLNADGRPTFKQLVDYFTEFSKDPGRYLVIKGDKYQRQPQYTSPDERDMIRALVADAQAVAPMECDEYLSTTMRRTVGLPGPSNMNATNTIAGVHPNGRSATMKRYSKDPRKAGAEDDETDSNARQIGVGNIRLDLPLDEDDYLMPTCQSQSSVAPGGGYMDLIGTPVCIDNPEYLMGSSAPSSIVSSSLTSQPNSPPPTQTIGIPVISPPLVDGEMSSDHEYYNDLQRELQPLQRNGTTATATTMV